MINLDNYTEHFKNLGPITVGGNNPEHPILLQELADAVEITQAKHILEIGFNNGGGTLAFLMAEGEPIVTAVDVNQNPQSSLYLSGEFFGRFFFKHMDSSHLPRVFAGTNFDLAYIDGDHSWKGVQQDIVSVLDLKIPYLLFDDTENKSHPYIVDMVHQGVQQNLWKIIKTYNNKILAQVIINGTNDGADHTGNTTEAG